MMTCSAKMFMGSLSLALALSLSGGGGAQAQDKPVSQVLGYDLYAGGLRALSATIDMKKEDGRYAIDLTSGTASGFKIVAPWTGQFAAEGWVLEGARQPENYKSISKGSEKTTVKTYKYSKNAELVSFSAFENETDKTPDPIDKSLTPAGLVDVLTATLQAIDRVEAGKGCTGSALIFDGDRNFTLSFKDTGIENMERTRFNVYEGPAHACTFSMEPGEGRWPKKKLRGWMMLQAQSRKLGSEPTVWFAQPDPAGAYVPVRVQVKSNYGTIILHLTSVTSTQGKVMQAAVKKSR
jgi:hypothetical protein